MTHNFTCKKLVKELQDPSSINELKVLLSACGPEVSCDAPLFKGKYRIHLLRNAFPYSKPMGDLFRYAYLICGTKETIVSEKKDETANEASSMDFPLEHCFDPVIEVSNTFSNFSLNKKELDEKIIYYPISAEIAEEIFKIYDAIDCDKIQKTPLVIKVMCNLGKVHTRVKGKNKIARLDVIELGEHVYEMQSSVLRHLKEEFAVGLHPSSNIEYSAYARYDMDRNGSNISTDTTLKPCKDFHLVLMCYWNNVSVLLELPAPESTCFAIIQAIGGDDASGAFHKFKEMKLIQILYEGLQGGVIIWPNVDTDETVLSEVYNFVTGKHVSHSKISDAPKEFSSFKESFSHTVQNNHISMDFTDNLWVILKDISSLEGLKRAFALIFANLKELDYVAFVHQRNTSTIAKVIKSEQKIFPSLNDLTPVKLLLEIGIEKLRKDYVEIFNGLNLVPLDSFSYFLQPELNSKAAIIQLQKMHTVLELAVIAVQCLNLPKMPLSVFLRNTLQYYTSVDHVDFQHLFTFQIPTYVIRSLVKSIHADQWELCFLNPVSEDNYWKQTVYTFNLTSRGDPPDTKTAVKKATKYSHAKTTMIIDKHCC